MALSRSWPAPACLSLGDACCYTRMSPSAGAAISGDGVTITHGRRGLNLVNARTPQGGKAARSFPSLSSRGQEICGARIDFYEPVWSGPGVEYQWSKPFFIGLDGGDMPRDRRRRSSAWRPARWQGFCHRSLSAVLHLVLFLARATGGPVASAPRARVGSFDETHSIMRSRAVLESTAAADLTWAHSST